MENNHRLHDNQRVYRNFSNFVEVTEHNVEEKSSG